MTMTVTNTSHGIAQFLLVHGEDFLREIEAGINFFARAGGRFARQVFFVVPSWKSANDDRLEGFHGEWERARLGHERE